MYCHSTRYQLCKTTIYRTKLRCVDPCHTAQYPLYSGPQQHWWMCVLTTYIVIYSPFLYHAIKNLWHISLPNTNLWRFKHLRITTRLKWFPTKYFFHLKQALLINSMPFTRKSGTSNSVYWQVVFKWYSVARKQYSDMYDHWLWSSSCQWNTQISLQVYHNSTAQANPGGYHFAG